MMKIGKRSHCSHRSHLSCRGHVTRTKQERGVDVETLFPGSTGLATQRGGCVLRHFGTRPRHTTVAVQYASMHAESPGHHPPLVSCVDHPSGLDLARRSSHVMRS